MAKSIGHEPKLFESPKPFEIRDAKPAGEAILEMGGKFAPTFRYHGTGFAFYQRQNRETAS
jgi:hypothetical protein